MVNSITSTEFEAKQIIKIDIHCPNINWTCDINNSSVKIPLIPKHINLGESISLNTVQPLIKCGYHIGYLKKLVF